MAKVKVMRWVGKHMVFFVLFMIGIAVLAYFSSYMVRYTDGGQAKAFSDKLWLIGAFWRIVLYTLLITIGFMIVKNRHTREATLFIDQLEHELAVLKKQKQTLTEAAYLQATNDLQHGLTLERERLERAAGVQDVLRKRPMRVIVPVALLEATFQLSYIFFLR